MLKLDGGLWNFWDFMPTFQDKDADGKGHLKDKQILSDTAIAKYRYTDWTECSCGMSKRPKDIFD